MRPHWTGDFQIPEGTAMAHRQYYRMIAMPMVIASALEDPVPLFDAPLFGSHRHRHHHLSERMMVCWLALPAD
jgi:hypothetical protein